MLPILPRVVLAVVASGATTFAQAPHVPVRTVDDVLPASTYAAVHFGGLTACREAANVQPLAAIVRTFVAGVAPELRDEQLDRHLEHAAMQLQDHAAAAGMRMADLQAIAQRPMALALGRLSIEGLGPSVALVVDAGDAAGALQRGGELLASWWASQGERVQRGQVTIGEHTVQHLHGQGMPPLFVGSLGGFFVVSNSRGYLRELADVLAGTPGLAASTRFGVLQRAQPQPVLASLFVDVQKLLGTFAPHLPYEAVDLADALGFGSIDAFHLASAAGRDGGHDRLHLGLGGSERGLLKALVAAPVDLSFTRACSPNTVLVAAGSLDVSAVLAAFERFAALLPDEARDELQREANGAVRAGLRSFGSSPLEVARLLAGFGTQVGVALSLEKGPLPKPELLVRLAVADAEVVQSLLPRLEAAVARRGEVVWRTRKVGAHEVRWCDLPLPGGALQLSPSYVLLADGLWLASDVAALVRTLRQSERANEENLGDSLAAQPDMQALADRAAGASGVLHVRAFRAAELGWRSVETLVYPQLDAHRDELGFGSEVLPDSEAVARALGTATMLYRVDDEGVTVEHHGTFTFGAMFAGLGWLVDDVLARATQRTY